MKTKDIKTLADLRQAKRELKLEMKLADERAKQGFLYSSVNKLFNEVESNSKTLQSPVGDGVNTALGFLSDQAQSRFNLSKTTKSLISVGIVLAAPIIAKKIQDFIDDRL